MTRRPIHAPIALVAKSRALAVLRGKTYVTPDDVRDLALPALRHRVRVTPEAEIDGLTADTCLDSLIKQVSVPR